MLDIRFGRQPELDSALPGFKNARPAEWVFAARVSDVIP